MIDEPAVAVADTAVSGEALVGTSDDDMREISYSPPAANAFDILAPQAASAPVNTGYDDFRIQSESPALDADAEDESEAEYSPPPVNQSLLPADPLLPRSRQAPARAPPPATGKSKKQIKKQRQENARVAKAQRKAAKAAKRAELRAFRAGPGADQVLPQSTAYVTPAGQYGSAMAHNDRRVQGDNPRDKSPSEESELYIKQESVTPPQPAFSEAGTSSRRLVLRPDGGADIEVVPAAMPQYNMDSPIAQTSRKDRNRQTRTKATQQVDSADSDLSPPRRKAGRDNGNLRRIASLQHATRPQTPGLGPQTEQAREPLKQRIIVDEYGNEYIAIPARAAKRPFTVAAPDSHDTQVHNRQPSVRAPSRATQQPPQALPENVIDLEDEEEEERAMMPPPPVVVKKQRKGQAKKEHKHVPASPRQAQPAQRTVSAIPPPVSNTAFHHLPAPQQQVQRSASVQGLPLPLPPLGFPQPPPPPPQQTLGLLGTSYAPPTTFLAPPPPNNMQPPAFASFPPPPRPFSTQPQPFPQYTQPTLPQPPPSAHQPFLQAPPPFPPQTPSFVAQTPHFTQAQPFATPFMQPQALQQPQFPYNGVPGQFPLPQGTPMLPQGTPMPPMWPHQR